MCNNSFSHEKAQKAQNELMFFLVHLVN